MLEGEKDAGWLSRQMVLPVQIAHETWRTITYTTARAKDVLTALEKPYPGHRVERHLNSFSILANQHEAISGCNYHSWKCFSVGAERGRKRREQELAEFYTGVWQVCL